MKKKFVKIILLLLFDLFVSCEQEVISEPPIETPAKNSKIIVNSKPQGAKIYLDGRNMGIKTPDSISWVLPGSHTITLKLGLFPDRSHKFQVIDSSKLVYSYDYYSDLANYGGISCSSAPSGANVFVNDTLLAQKTPLTVNNLFPGTYEVKVSFPFYRSDSSLVNVKGGEIQNVAFVLEDTTVCVSYNINNSPVTSNHITSMLIDKNGRKWFGSRDGGLFCFFKNKWTIYNKGFTVRAILIDDQENIWVATTGGLQFFDKQSEKWFNLGKYLPSTNVNCLFMDSSKNLWIGTSGGLVIYNGSSWEPITTGTEAGPLINNVVTCINEDNMHRIWIGTQGGINLISNKVWYYLTTKEMNLPQTIGNGIQDIRVDRDGIVWIAHLQNIDSKETGGLSINDGRTFSVVSINGFSTSSINRIWIDEKNYKWFSTSNGLARFKLSGDLFTLTTSNSKIPAMQVSDAMLDSYGDLWIATYGGGIAKLKKGNF